MPSASARTGGRARRPGPWRPRRAARPPRPAPTRRPGDGTGRSAASSRSIGSSSRSPLCPTPPPRMTSAGSTTGAIAAIPSARRAASISTAAIAAGWPRRAAAKTFFGVSGVAHPEALRGAHDAGRRRRLLERPAPPVHRILRVAGTDGQVGDLAGGAVRPAVQLAVQHQPHADAGSHPQVHEAVDVAAVPAGALAEGREVHVVLERQVGAELLAEGLDQALAAPAGEVRGQRDRARARGRARPGSRSPPA